MRSLDAIIKNWPTEETASGESAKKVISCREDFETEYIIQSILELHPHTDRELILNAMRMCCKEIAAPYFPRPFLICLLRRLGIS